MSESKNMGRRDLLRRALVVLVAAPVMGPALASCGGGAPSCSGGGLTPPQLAVRSGVHYLEHGPVATRQCAGCQLYTGTPTACGTCSSVPGSINPQGTCDAFIARA